MNSSSACSAWPSMCKPPISNTARKDETQGDGTGDDNKLEPPEGIAEDGKAVGEGIHADEAKFKKAPGIAQEKAKKDKLPKLVTGHLDILLMDTV